MANTLSPKAKEILAKKAKDKAFKERVQAQSSGKTPKAASTPKKANNVSWRKASRQLIGGNLETKGAVDNALGK
tara:strand:- start:788 stop:1009 length:222 start_codon:yes stop_codon:yes gene_type:complete